MHATVTDPAGGTGVDTVAVPERSDGHEHVVDVLDRDAERRRLRRLARGGGDRRRRRRLRLPRGSTDVAGNTGTSATVAGVRVDTTGPVVNVTAPAAAAKVHGTISVDATAVDASGVASVQLLWSVAGANT